MALIAYGLEIVWKSYNRGQVAVVRGRQVAHAPEIVWKVTIEVRWR